ncbi:MAG: SET domain-containing protein-lysine N-methyltransferase [Candidatus Omnitrophica bacterium]|nr:SET domain-containing protein-lysine N-methyltransferase [Candidatus Omnitrophota bacterium]
MRKKNLTTELLRNRGFSWLSPKVQLRTSDIQGKGLFAVQNIKKNELINMCGGAIITEKDYEKLEKKYKEFLFNYATQIADDLYLLSGLGEDELEDDDFLNHSCSPNCGVKGQFAIVAMRDIKKGEELSLDYAMIDVDPSVTFSCFCGAKKCRKTVRGNDWKNPVLQKRYKGYFSWYIEEKIKNLK